MAAYRPRPGAHMFLEAATEATPASVTARADVDLALHHTEAALAKVVKCTGRCRSLDLATTKSYVHDAHGGSGGVSFYAYSFGQRRGRPAAVAPPSSRPVNARYPRGHWWYAQDHPTGPVPAQRAQRTVADTNEPTSLVSVIV